MTWTTLWHGDCLELMSRIPDGAVDLVLCDLPYGTTDCKWDSVIPFEPLWKQYWRVCNGAVVLTGTQPFVSNLITSQLKHFKYEIVWDKVNKYTGALQANIRPMRRHENIIIFSKTKITYNKQFRQGKPYAVKRTKGLGEYHDARYSDVTRLGINDGNHNPCSILPIEGDNKKEAGLHPTQKPVALMEYLIKTYTNEGATVLDNTMGSGTTGVACVNTGRNFVGIEKDEAYYNIAVERVEKAKQCRAGI